MITQAEADELIGMRKFFVDDGEVGMPPGVDVSFDLVGEDERERFTLDLWRGSIRLVRCRYQTRARNAIVLVRLDIDGAPHRNPDGEEIGGTHLHVYKEGFADKWAFEVDPEQFRDVTDLRQMYEDFCRFCNIEGSPSLQKEVP